MDFILNIDNWILSFIQEYIANPFLDRVFPLITSIGDTGLLWIAIAVVLLFSRKNRKVGVLLIVALLITTFLGEGILKNLIQRPRPFLAMNKDVLLIDRPSSYSFPSGHTGSSFAAAYILANYFKRYRIIFYIIASLIAFSRLYLYVHYPTDILGGIALGVFSGYISLFATRYIRR